MTSWSNAHPKLSAAVDGLFLPLRFVDEQLTEREFSFGYLRKRSRRGAQNLSELFGMREASGMLDEITASSSGHDPKN